DGRVAGVRIGVPRQYFFDSADLNDEVRRAVETALSVLEAAGATVIDVTLRHAAVGRNAQRAIMFSEAYSIHARDLQTRLQLYGKYTRQQLLQGAFYTGTDYVNAQRVRSV